MLSLRDTDSDRQFLRRLRNPDKIAPDLCAVLLSDPPDDKNSGTEVRGFLAREAPIFFCQACSGIRMSDDSYED